MKKIPRQQPVAIGNHHSPLPLAVQACFQQLTVHRRRQFYPHQIQSILVRAVNWLGDAILTLPAIRQLKRFFPQASLSVLALDRVAPVFLQQPEVAEIIRYLPKPPASSLKDWLQSIYRLRQRRFDLAVIFPNSLESALVAWLLGVPHRVGYNTEGRSCLLTQVVHGPDKMAGLHQVYRHEGILQAFGPVSADGFPELVLTADGIGGGITTLGGQRLAAPPENYRPEPGRGLWAGQTVVPGSFRGRRRPLAGGIWRPGGAFGVRRRPGSGPEKLPTPCSLPRSI